MFYASSILFYWRTFLQWCSCCEEATVEVLHFMLSPSVSTSLFSRSWNSARRVLLKKSKKKTILCCGYWMHCHYVRFYIISVLSRIRVYAKFAPVHVHTYVTEARNAHGTVINIDRCKRPIDPNDFATTAIQNWKNTCSFSTQTTTHNQDAILFYWLCLIVLQRLLDYNRLMK